MEDNLIEGPEPSQGEVATEEKKSPFDEVKTLNPISSLNVLIQAANTAQKSGQLGFRDSILVAGAIELLTQHLTKDQ